MVPSPADYVWSSYAANVGEAEDVLVTAHQEYLALSDSPRQRQATYRGLGAVDKDAVDAIRRSTNGGLPLGGETLRAGLVAAGKRVEHARPGPRPAESRNDQGDLDLEIAP
jgi:putative transposase